MALTYQDLKNLLDRPNIRLDNHISIWDGEECREVENCYIKRLPNLRHPRSRTSCPHPEGVTSMARPINRKKVPA